MRVRIGCARVSRYHHTSGRERGGREGGREKKKKILSPTHTDICVVVKLFERNAGGTRSPPRSCGGAWREEQPQTPRQLPLPGTDGGERDPAPGPDGGDRPPPQ